MKLFQARDLSGCPISFEGTRDLWWCQAGISPLGISSSWFLRAKWERETVGWKGGKKGEQ